MQCCQEYLQPRYRIDFSGDELIVQCPTFGHEVVTTLFTKLAQTSGSLPSFLGSDSILRLGASANIDLEDGAKSPDYGLYEKHPDLADLPLLHVLPTVVWEVAYSDKEAKLAKDLARHVACSNGGVRLAIGVNIEHVANSSLPVLQKVTCVFWEVDSMEEFATLEESGGVLGQLTRCDKYARKARDYVVPAATRYYCVTLVNKTYLKFFVSAAKTYSVSRF